MRALLLATTALPGVLGLAGASATAQPAPNAQPSGGQVVAGSAGIGQSAAGTTITQSSSRAAIDWRSFNVGSQQRVTFRQPGVASSTLNRVTGPDPSAIAGRITANGEIIITNPSGVVFYPGAQVDAASVIAAAPGIATRDYMAGRLAFSQPARPGAAVVNAGTLTARQAGLVGLVAPAVANSGVITARLGHVVLAGAEAATLDLYGDGLVAVDVTRKVRSVPLGPDGRPAPALVTNTGTVLAPGGTVQLTASAIDGVVRDLIDAGGTIAADSSAGQGGTVVLAGVGGDVVVRGRITARGLAAGQAGGSVEVVSDGLVTLAASSAIRTSGVAAGGTIAIGTTLARAAGGPGTASAVTARRVTIARGAAVSADAGRAGNGGRVAVISRDRTIAAGNLSARGGRGGGDGGTVEISGHSVSFGGHIDTGAAHGANGAILIDPTRDTIDVAQATALEAMTGNVTLTAGTLEVAASVALGAGQTLELDAGGSLTIDAGTEASAGSLILCAGDSAVTPFDAAGSLSVFGNLSAVDSIQLFADVMVGDGLLSTGLSSFPAGTIQLAPASPGRAVELIASGSADPGQLVLQIGLPGSAGLSLGFVATGTLEIGGAQAGAITIGHPGDTIDFSAGSASISSFLAAGASVSEPAAALDVATLEVQAAGSASLRGTGNSIDALGSSSVGGLLQLTDAASLSIAGSVGAGTIDLSVPAGVGEGANGALVTTLFSATGALLLLDNPANRIDAVGTLTAAIGNIIVADSTALAIIGAVEGPSSITFDTAGSLTQGAASTISGSGAVTLIAGDPSIPGADPAAAISLYGSIADAGTTTLQGGGSGRASLAGPISTVGLVVTAAADVLVASTASLRGIVVGSILELPSLQITAGGAVTIAPSGSVLDTDFPATIGVTAGGGFTQSAGSVIDAGSHGAVTVTAGSAAPGAGGISIAGSVMAPDGFVDLSAGTAGVALSGMISTVGQTGLDAVALSTTGTITQTAGVINTSSLSGGAAAILLAGAGGGGGPANGVSTLNGLTVTGGGFTLAEAGGVTLAILGPLSVPAGQTIALFADIITGPGTLSAPNGVIELAPGTPGLPVELIASGTGDAGQLDIIANTAATGGFALVQAIASTIEIGDAQAGPITLGHPGDVIDLTTVGSAASGAYATAILSSGAAVTEPGAGVSVPILEISSAAAVSLAGSLNAIGALGPSSVAGLLQLTDAGPLAVSGPVFAGDLQISAGPITLTGQIAADTLSLVSTGSIVQGSGRIVAGSLSGAAAGLASFGATQGAVADIGTLDGFVIDPNTFILHDANSLVLSGLLSAADISILASGGLTLNGGTIATSGLPLAPGGLPGSELSVLPGAGGRATILQLGTTIILGLAGSAAHLGFALPASGGGAAFANLVGPGASVVLSLGAGTAAGSLDVASLLVRGADGRASLQGSVGGMGGAAAAGLAQIQPAPGLGYTLNGCEIGVSCGEQAQIPENPGNVQEVPLAAFFPDPESSPQEALGAPDEFLASLIAEGVSAGAPDVFITRDTRDAQGLFAWSLQLAQDVAGIGDLAPQLVPHARPRPPVLSLRVLTPPLPMRDGDPDLVLPNISDRDY